MTTTQPEAGDQAQGRWAVFGGYEQPVSLAVPAASASVCCASDDMP